MPDVSWLYASHHIRHMQSHTILSYYIFHSTFYKLIQYSVQRNLYHQHGSLILCICHFWPFTSSSNECDTQKAPGHEALLKNQLHILLHRVNLKPAMAEAPGTKPNAAQNKQWDICFKKIPKVSKSHVGSCWTETLEWQGQHLQMCHSLWGSPKFQSILPSSSDKHETFETYNVLVLSHFLQGFRI